MIVALDDVEITDPTSLGAEVAKYQPGDTVTITSGPLTGTVAELYAEAAGTTSTARIYTLEVQA